METSLKKTKELYFPPEILYEIFQNLNLRDLSRIASVNKLCNAIATRVLAKRGPEATLISYLNANFYDSIRVKPYVTLMFTPNLIETNQFESIIDLRNPPEIKNHAKPYKEVLDKYKERIPHYLASMGIDYLMIDEKLITNSNELPEGILSLIIPKYRDLKIRAVCMHDFPDDVRLMDEFFPEDSQSRATFIIFGQSMFRYFDFFRELKKRLEKRKHQDSVWGAYFYQSPVATFPGIKLSGDPVEYVETDRRRAGIRAFILEEGICVDDDYDDYEPTKYEMFAMSITGSSLESSSTVLDCVTKKQEFDQKLLDFRNQLRFKRHSIGLACGPGEVSRCCRLWSERKFPERDVYMNYREIMHAIKVIFPDVPFTGIFYRSMTCYGLKSKTEDPKMQLQYLNSVSLMILTYD